MKKRLKIVIASNSQGTSIGVKPEQSYPSILQEKLGSNFEVHRLLFSGWTLNELMNNVTDNVTALKPDIVVMNLGIIECSQRILSKQEKKFLRMLPLSKKITNFLHKNRKTVLKLRNFFRMQVRYGSIYDYEATLYEITNRFKEHQILYLFLKIPEFPDSGQAIGNQYINQDAKLFNKAMDKYISVSTEFCKGGWLMTDYQAGTVHFSEAGHNKVADLLILEILDLLKFHKKVLN